MAEIKAKRSVIQIWIGHEIGRERAYVDGELARERPTEGVVRGGAFASGAFSGVEEGGAQGGGGVDEMSLVGVAGGSGFEEAVEGEVNGERGGRG